METVIATFFSPGIPRKIGFERVLSAQNSPAKYVIINTLPSSDQGCLIAGTLALLDEERVINELLNSYIDKTVVIYGRNSTDDSPDKKHNQLVSLGLKDILVYSGGLFEWLLLQDIYGSGEFRTTSKCGDLLAFR
jgi:hypothetical protein